MSLPPNDFTGNIDRFSGFADLYDKYRPEPPAIIAPILMRLAQSVFPQRVVDLGCGTGLSTRYWTDKVREVIGIEPSADMRHQAEVQTRARNVSYREGLSHQTGLPDQCAQIVTCSQALHWMEPQATFQEVARILNPGGVFAAYDYDWPPTTGSWEADAAYEECMRRVRVYEKELEAKSPVKRWGKNQHLARMKASGCFRYVKEIVVHHLDNGNAERFIGIFLSQGGVMALLKNGLSEKQMGIDRLREIAKQTLGTEDESWYWSYRLRLGVVLQSASPSKFIQSDASSKSWSLIVRDILFRCFCLSSCLTIMSATPGCSFGKDQTFRCTTIQARVAFGNT
jgi:ubiquinone/menaquinone biosynthesis C-methylase UbiE